MRLFPMLILCSDGTSVAFPVVCIFLFRGAYIDATVAAVIADAAFGNVFDPGVVGVANVLVVDAVHRGVVEEAIVFPTAAFIAATAVTVSVIDSAVVAHVRTLVTFVEQERVAAPSPISGGPEEANFRRFDPCAVDPIVVVTIPGPITRSPDVAVAGTDGLLVNGERWRPKRHRNTDLSERGGGEAHP